mgnify:CR=1 FL=1
MSYNSGLDDLGDAIEAIIDHAVRSQDFQHLNQTIRQAVNTAVDTGSDAVRRAVGGATTIWVDFQQQKAVELPDHIRARVTP